MTKWEEHTDGGWIRFEPQIGKVTVIWNTINGHTAWFLFDETFVILVPLSFVRLMGVGSNTVLNMADDILRCLRKQREYENWIN